MYPQIDPGSEVCVEINGAKLMMRLAKLLQDGFGKFRLKFPVERLAEEDAAAAGSPIAEKTAAFAEQRACAGIGLDIPEGSIFLQCLNSMKEVKHFKRCCE